MPSNAQSPPPDASGLYQAALAHLARFATTEAGLRRVLTRRVDRWASTQSDRDRVAPIIASAREAIEEVIGRLKHAGALSDTAFAESRANSLIRAGQSIQAVQARLIAKGVAPDVARAASVSDAQTELAAALVLVRKRRFGPYRAIEEVSEAVHTKELGVLARAGFGRDIAKQALAMSRDEAEIRIFNLRR